MEPGVAEECHVFWSRAVPDSCSADLLGERLSVAGEGDQGPALDERRSEPG